MSSKQSSKQASKPSSSSSGPASPSPNPPNPPKFDSVDFRTRNCTLATYDKFITDIRNIVTRDAGDHHGVPFLRSPTGNLYDDFLLINLYDIKDQLVVVVCKKSNLYLVAFKAKSQVFWFTPDTNEKEIEKIFPKTKNPATAVKHVPVGIQASYIKLEGNSKTRSQIPLGMSKMSDSISQLYALRSAETRSVIALNFLVILQLTSESVRLGKFNQKIRDVANPSEYGFYSTFKPSLYDCECQTSWDTLSRRFCDYEDMSAKIDPPIDLPCGMEDVTEADVIKAMATGIERDMIDRPQVTNMRQARNILRVLNSRS